MEDSGDPGPAAVKGILKASTLGAVKPSGAGDGDDKSRWKGKAPVNDQKDAVHTTFHAFHGRVADVFANLGPGLTRGDGGVGGSGASESTSDTQPPAWMPKNMSVVRRGRDVRDGSDEEDSEENLDDDGAAEVSGSDDDGPTQNGAGTSGAGTSGQWDNDDLDCLASDDEADDGTKHVTLGRSVGRCEVVDREDEFDYFDKFAEGSLRTERGSKSGRLGDDLETDLHTDRGKKRGRGEGDTSGLGLAKVTGVARGGENTEKYIEGERTIASASGSGSKARLAKAVYVPPGKRTCTSHTASRGVAWDGDVREVRREPRPGSVPRRAGNRKTGASWVPDHVKNPHKYDVYVLEEPLIIGGRDGGRDGGGMGGSRVKSAPTKDINTSETEDKKTETVSEKPSAPTFQAIKSSTETARLAAKRRREERVGVALGEPHTTSRDEKKSEKKSILSFDAEEEDA
tara:strand:- start:11359 stop:12729 length:1371 start_codon:yes stop_codon:yes gene_type:complete